MSSLLVGSRSGILNRIYPDVQSAGWELSGHPKQDLPWMFSPLVGSHLGILKSVHPECPARWLGIVQAS